MGNHFKTMTEQCRNIEILKISGKCELICNHKTIAECEILPSRHLLVQSSNGNTRKCVKPVQS